MIRLEFLGRLADLAGASGRDLADQGPLDHCGLIAAAALPATLAAALNDPRIRLAKNGEVVAAAQLSARAGDTIAFLPPVSGG